MGNLIWLSCALPSWFVGAAMRPFSGGVLTLVPAIGLLALLIGAAMGVIRRKPRLLLFLWPVAFSQLFVAAAGLFRGQLVHGVDLVVGAFMVAQLLAAGYLIWRLNGARIEAAILSVFVACYGLFAGFIATMSFSDSWL